MVPVQVENRFLSHPIPEDIKATQQGKFIILEVDPGLSILEMVQTRDLRFTQPMVVLINDAAADLAEPLKAGDRVRLLPQIAGGLF